MRQAAAPAGTDVNATNDSIIDAELEKLKDYRRNIKEENESYLEAHPELRSLVDDFISAAIAQKPNDLIKFGSVFFSTYRTTQGRMGYCPVVFAGPSGVGKGTLTAKLMEKFPKIFGFSVSHTTRRPREGEIDGVHYHFVGKSDMEDAIERGEFVEFARVHANTYGTSFKAVEQVRAAGKVCILDIDVQGVQTVKRSMMDCKFVFIAPPSMEVLEKRLRDRGTETADKIKLRMGNAEKEMAYGTKPGNFDAVIVNDFVEVAFAKIVKLLEGWFPDLDLYVDR